MTYELTLPLKRGSVEIEFEDADDLERKLAALDVARVDALVAAALRGKAPAKKASAKKRRGAKKA